MDTIRVDISYRPIRIGWAVAAGDMVAFRQAVRLSHAQWGGRYNPILVVDRPEEADQLIDLFRVDMIWPLGGGEAVKAFPSRYSHLINPFLGEELHVEGGAGKTSQVIDVHNALAYLRDKEPWKAVCKKGVRLYSWSAQDPLADVLLIQLGDYPTAAEIGIDYRELVRSATEAANHVLTPDGQLPADIFEHAHIASISRFGLEPHRDNRERTYPGFFAGDGSNFDDLVSFWNLRAADIPLIFVDRRHASRTEGIVAGWSARMREQLARRRNAWDRVLAVWSNRDGDEAIKGIDGMPILSCRVSSATWNGLNIHVPMMQFGETSVLGVLGGDDGRPKVSLAFSNKPFSEHVGFYRQHLVASVSYSGGLDYRAQHTLIPPFIPELNEFYSRTMHFEYNRIRSEPGRLGLVIDARDHDGFFHALPFANLIERIFGLAVYDSKLSPGGLITRQLISRLDGPQAGRVFKIPGVRRLIKKHGPRATFKRDDAILCIGETESTEPEAKFSNHHDLYIEPRASGNLTPQLVFEYLVAKGMFLIGVDVRCPTCGLESWVAVDQLKQHVTCEMCGEIHDATRQLVNSDWRFRRSGILGLEKNLQGSIPVMLTLQQLDTTCHGLAGRTAYSPSLDLNPRAGTKREKCEVDLVWMTAKPRWQEPKTAIVICECKEQGSIDDNDIKHLREVAEALPAKRFDVFILLAKLGAFSAEEVARAKSLNGSNDYCRVILLTARELEPYSIYERTRKECQFDERMHDPEGLAQVTAQVYFSELKGSAKAKGP